MFFQIFAQASGYIQTYNVSNEVAMLKLEFVPSKWKEYYYNYSIINTMLSIDRIIKIRSNLGVVLDSVIKEFG